MSQRSATINQVLVHLFNDLLRIEENTLHREGVELSMREIHIIEAVCEADEDGNTMTSLAAKLRVTVGSVTVAVATLERKGYLVRRRSKTDRRRVHVLPTDNALAVERVHRDYHRRMTEAVMRAVPEEQLDVLIQSLGAVNDYFYGQEELK
ncbi:MAG: winged helix-turn-helix transcriptional regulator [Christensenellaceae bacterium]|nr:winged helix-turn-helix transcriptional regulator [Christensenellaceae bacterium]